MCEKFFGTIGVICLTILFSFLKNYVNKRKNDIFFRRIYNIGCVICYIITVVLVLLLLWAGISYLKERDLKNTVKLLLIGSILLIGLIYSVLKYFFDKRN